MLIPFAVAPLLALAVCKPINSQIKTDHFDAVIVGGGPSGLSALSGLARMRRNVLLIDSGEYRNYATRAVHDVIGSDGFTPAYFRWRAREGIAAYDTVTAVNGTVTSIARAGKNFTVSINLSSGRKDVTARKIVLGTGLRDIIPSTSGVRECWGCGCYWCGWCDGHEHADQKLGLFTNLSDAASLVREISTLNRDIIAFVNGTNTPEERALADKSFPGWDRYLQLNKVPINNRTIKRLVRLRDGAIDHARQATLATGPEHDLFRLDFVDGGASVEREAFFTSWPDEQRSDVGARLGVQLWGGRLAVDNRTVTNVDGVYAIGDANSDNTTNVPHALFTGKRAAVYLHVALAKEDATAQLQAKPGEVPLHPVKRRDVAMDPRSIWERMNTAPDDILHAGEYKP